MKTIMAVILLLIASIAWGNAEKEAFSLMDQVASLQLGEEGKYYYPSNEVPFHLEVYAVYFEKSESSAIGFTLIIDDKEYELLTSQGYTGEGWVWGTRSLSKKSNARLDQTIDLRLGEDSAFFDDMSNLLRYLIIKGALEKMAEKAKSISSLGTDFAFMGGELLSMRYFLENGKSVAVNVISGGTCHHGDRLVFIKIDTDLVAGPSFVMHRFERYIEGRDHWQALSMRVPKHSFEKWTQDFSILCWKIRRRARIADRKEYQIKEAISILIR